MTVSASPSIHIVTLGCPKNEVDSDRMRASLGAAGARLTDDPSGADVVIVNTCAFIEAATEESIAAVLELAADERSRKRGRRLIVTGCMPSRYGDELAAALTEADAFVPVAEEASVVEVVSALLGTPLRPAAGAPERTAQSPYAYLQLSDGCHRRCAYCTIPAIRGPYRSRPVDAVLAEARLLIAGGARELVLIGQDVTAYGRDRDDGLELPDVLEAVADLEGADRVRLMYAQPDGVSDRLLQVMANLPAVCHYLDMPLQHASAGVLRAMRRGGDAEAFLDLIGRIRAAMPDVSLRSTVIVGFPGETEADVAELLAFVREAAFDHLGVFMYSAEEGTPAAEMADQVAEDDKVERFQRVRDVADAVGHARAAEKIGKELMVLIDGVDEDGETTGRTCGQAPDIDGVVLFADAPEAGTLTKVRITDSIGYDLVGEVL